MTLLQAFLLALVQGVTEFLPISSSAHLILAPYLFGWRDQGLVFDVATNTGTLAAVMLYFRRDLAGLGRAFAGELGGAGGGTVEGMPARRLAAALVVGTIPVAVAGLLIDDWVGSAGRSALVIAAASIVFGIALGAADRLGSRARELATLTLRDALLIGGMQALALVPGTSRSGITMTAALMLGFHRPAAARFAFLLAIPVGLLVTGWDALQMLRGGGTAHPEWGVLVVGLVVSALSAYLVIGVLLAWLRRQTMMPFVLYRVALGLLLLALVWGGLIPAFPAPVVPAPELPASEMVESPPRPAALPG
ncbi:MAG TPA: undecaprenyl-diphosphate phosphatase [Thermoanaerobaculia bacterium]|nr:undecaprenyl-diphosphate phosphatase [Thermoanaerobaculia bacterium]